MSLTFGLLLRRWRRDANLSQEALAELAQISPGAVSSYERGIRAAPHRATVALLADVLRLTGDARADFEASARRKPVAPPLASSRRNSNLPAELDSFVGRESAVEEVRDLLGRHRIVTISGDGGVGKTRLALAVASALENRKPDGVWLADLSSLSGERDVEPLVARLFDVEAAAGAAGAERLCAVLQKRDMLLVLDNCEHVIGAAAALAIAVARSCPSVSILATSRERLRISGEAAYALAPLPIPPEEERDRGIVASYPAVKLFIDRASAVAIDIAKPERVLEIAELCRLVDGIPLAIEIVASRVDGVGLPSLRASLRSSLALDIAGNRDLSQRQQTMQATLDWSYASLTPAEQVLFRRLSVFAGGWTLEAAQAVCSDDLLSEDAVRDGLDGLVAKSFFRCDATADSPRYTMLHIHRLFGAAKSAAQPADAALSVRHAGWVGSLARHAQRLKHGTNRSDWHGAFYPELDNIRTALHGLLHEREANDAAEIVGGLQPLWYENGLVVELRGYFDELASILDVTKTSAIVAMFLYYRSQFVDPAAGYVLAKRALEMEREIVGGEVPGFSLNTASFARRNGDLAEAKRIVDGVFARLDRGAKPTRLVANAHVELARIAGVAGRMADKRAELEAALEIFVALGETFYVAHVRSLLADVEFLIGDATAAADIATTALAEARLAGSRRDEMYLLCNRAGYRLAAGDLSGARSDGTAAIALARDRAPIILSFALQHVAAVAALGGDVERAARVAGFVDRRLAQLGVVREETDARLYAILDDALRASIPDETARAAFAELGERDTDDDVLRVAGVED